MCPSLVGDPQIGSSVFQKPVAASPAFYTRQEDILSISSLCLLTAPSFTFPLSLESFLRESNWSLQLQCMDWESTPHPPLPSLSTSSARKIMLACLTSCCLFCYHCLCHGCLATISLTLPSSQWSSLPTCRCTDGWISPVSWYAVQKHIFFPHLWMSN